jgi:hypothetical protein
MDERVEQAVAMLAAGVAADVAAAMSVLREAADDGVAEAWRWLATLNAAGVGAPQNWDVALDCLARAAEGGSASARGQLLALAEGSAAAADDWRGLRARVSPGEWLKRAPKQVLSTTPRLVAVRGFLPRGACEWLRQRAEGGLSQALLLTGEPPPADRTYRAHAFNFVDSDVVLLLTRARIAANTSLPTGAFEVSQILHYREGETFGLHWDYLRPEVAAEGAEIAANGQRIATFLIYLNDGFEGGRTHFPRLDISFLGEPGDALYWANIDAAGATDPATLHAGLAPIGGEKYLLSQGVRSLARV